MSIVFKEIGTIYSPFKESRGTPIQPSAAKGVKGTIEIKDEYKKGLKDLDGFSHIMLICHLNLCKDYSLEVIPFMDKTERGVFATRAPSRPNPIGISVVRLKSIEDNILHIEDLDLINGTPLLDIKPYVPEMDNRNEEVHFGWLENTIHIMGLARDDGRFSDK